MKVKLIDYGYKSIPNRAHYNDSGADVFATENMLLEPRTVTSIPVGLGIELPDGYDAVIHCKSGLSKDGLLIANAPIDAGYRGEIHAIIYNSNDQPYYIEKGRKIGQLVVRPVIYVDFVESLGEERNDGAFGSTGL